MAFEKNRKNKYAEILEDAFLSRTLSNFDTKKIVKKRTPEDSLIIMMEECSKQHLNLTAYYIKCWFTSKTTK